MQTRLIGQFADSYEYHTNNELYIKRQTHLRLIATDVHCLIILIQKYNTIYSVY